MSSKQTTLFGSVALLLVFGIFGWWLFIFSKPSAADISAKTQPPTPLPVISLQQVAQETANLEIKGNLPINLNDAGLGRQDPFASR